MFISSQQSSRGGGGINSQAIKAAVTVYFWSKPYLCLPVRTFSGWNLCLLCSQMGIAPTYWDPNVRISVVIDALKKKHRASMFSLKFSINSYLYHSNSVRGRNLKEWAINPSITHCKCVCMVQSSFGGKKNQDLVLPRLFWDHLCCVS